MKKIGILFGQENSFPQAFVDRVNSKAIQQRDDITLNLFGWIKLYRAKQNAMM